MARAKRASARRSRPRRSGQPRLVGRVLRVGDREVPLYSGAMHYWRLEREAWRPGLEQLRDLGLPIVETYVPWQVHETGPGEHDFGEADPRKDLGAFVDLAADLELLVFARPGPHINAEMTYFGLPERIVYDRACQARSPRQNPVLQGFPPVMFPVPSYASRTFLDEVGRWYDAVGEVLAPRLWPAGPVVLLQVDNEGSYYFRDATYDQDYHPDAVAEWRKFLEKRYGTLAATAEAHRAEYGRWDDAAPPTRFRAEQPPDLVPHLDWALFREQLLTKSLSRMKRRLSKAGLKGPVTVHNFPLGDQGVPMSSVAIEEVVDLVGFDYYHARREHRAVKRRTLYLAGTHPVPYAPEMGIGAPAWFTPLANDDSLYTTLCALAYGLRGFNLYMAVDRDRWYGAPVDAQGNPRVDAGVWKHLLGKLHEVGFHALSRRAEVGLMLPREYARLSRATSLLGFFSPTVLEAVGGNPVEACREDTFGFEGPIQVLWWKMLARFAEALTRAGVPYVYVDGDAPADRLEALRVVITPSFELCDKARWKRLTGFAEAGGTVVYGPAMPSLDPHARHALFEVPRGGRRVLIDTDEDAVDVVDELVRDLSLARPYPARPAPVETAVHEDSAGPRVIFVVNPGKAPVTAEVDVPAAMAFEDLMSGERFSGAATVAIPMKGWSCRMLSMHGAASEDTGSGSAVAS
ncbi:MAG TPA: beta-galactosidase [Sandaracinaceae bacterium LLY-WYZ-13_1]|nr:beta-galactosidase [Sandaracinaceae bacterium LLY-WYZ-13_1]